MPEIETIDLTDRFLSAPELFMEEVDRQPNDAEIILNLKLDQANPGLLKVFLEKPNHKVTITCTLDECDAQSKEYAGLTGVEWKIL